MIKTQDTKKLYAEVYKVDAHNYGELNSDGLAMPERAKRHFSVVRHNLDQFNIPETATILEVGAALGQI